MIKPPYVTLEDLDGCISEFVNAELVNSNPSSTVTWNETDQRCLHRTQDGIYMMGFREYFEIPISHAVDWLKKNGYKLPNELLAFLNTEENQCQK